MKVKTTYFIFCLFFGVVLSVQAQVLDPEALLEYEKKEFVSETGRMPYAILLPENYNPKTTYPLLLFLHGAGERGSDNNLQLTHGAAVFKSRAFRKKYPAIVVFPQCAKEDYWSSVQKETAPNGGPKFSFKKKGKPTTAMVLLQGLLQEILETYPLDKNRLYVGGLSMGGMGTFELVRRNPRLFAAAFPICGGAAPKRFRKYKRPAWWVFHGHADSVVPSYFSTAMVKGLNRVGASVTYSLYQGIGHNSWDHAFSEAALFPWLFSQAKK